MAQKRPTTRRRWFWRILGGGVFVGSLLILRAFWVTHHFKSARSALAKLHFAEARWHWSRCLWVMGNEPRYLCHAAEAARRDGDREAARQYLKRCRSSKDPDPLVAREALLLEVEVDPTESAVAALRPLLTGNVEDLPILEALSQGYLATQRPALARSPIETILRHRPDHPRAYAWRAQCHGQLGEHKRALAEARRAVELAAHSLEARRALAEALSRTGDAAEAVAEFQWLEERRSEDAEILLLHAACLRDLADHEGAHVLLERILSREPTHPGALVALGRLDLQRGDTSRAIVAARRATEASPGDPECHRLLVLSLANAGQQEEAAMAGEVLRRVETAVGELVRRQDALRTQAVAYDLNLPNEKPRP